ncbi:MAG: RNA methyltransferase [Thermoguttaceae bacterium]|nr:RNA methyltransferase [Thermoguttaceae bacterium]MDW8078275.1 RNA methyltransferase [Thermoguttaceae bacterium]
MGERIWSLDDPRIAFYRNLRERTLRGESIFLAEGKVVTERLLRSPYQVESLLLDERYEGDLAPLVPPGVPIYVTTEKLLEQIVGFKYHQGVLAAGRRKPEPSFTEVLPELAGRPKLRLIVCPEVTKPENLGLIFRTAAAFDLEGVILGPQACDPFSRRVLRVSMGAVLFSRFARSRHLVEDLATLRSKLGVKIVATVVDPNAERLEDFRFPEKVALLVGGEYYGLPQPLVDIADHRVTIPMSDKVDSLNLGVATGIFVYQMCRQHASRQGESDQPPHRPSSKGGLNKSSRPGEALPPAC